MGSNLKPMLMSLPDFAAHVSISLSTLRRRIDEGVIPVLHEGRRVSVPVAVAEKRYMEYLIAQEREYRVARANAAKVDQPAPEPPTLADRGWSIAQRVGFDLEVDLDNGSSRECEE